MVVTNLIKILGATLDSKLYWNEFISNNMQKLAVQKFSYYAGIQPRNFALDLEGGSYANDFIRFYRLVDQMYIYKLSPFYVFQLIT